MRTPPANTRGFALIEALIAMLIFSIAALGLVGLQASLNRASANAKMRADAVFLANELISTIWADPANLSAYKTNCAGYDPCRIWAAKVSSMLPSGTPTLSICLPTDSGSSCTDDRGYQTAGRVGIRIDWTVPQEGSHHYETSSTIVANPAL